MVFKDKVSIITESKVSDGMGGYTVDKDTVCTIKCKVAPYNVTEHDIIHMAKPWSSVNFYTKDDIIEYFGKLFKRDNFDIFDIIKALENHLNKIVNDSRDKES